MNEGPSKCQRRTPGREVSFPAQFWIIWGPSLFNYDLVAKSCRAWGDLCRAVLSQRWEMCAARRPGPYLGMDMEAHGPPMVKL